MAWGVGSGLDVGKWLLTQGSKPLSGSTSHPIQLRVEAGFFVGFVGGFLRI